MAQDTLPHVSCAYASLLRLDTRNVLTCASCWLLWQLYSMTDFLLCLLKLSEV